MVIRYWGFDREKVSRVYYNYGFKMEYQKINIAEDKSVKIQCPSCNTNKTVLVEKLPKKFYFIVKCRCGAKFVVQRELRAKFRKNVHLTGVINRACADQNSKPEKILNVSAQDTLIAGCMIINISPNGLGIFLTGRSTSGIIKPGEILLVKFNLDNSVSTKVEKKVIVKAVKNNYIGCEFFDNEKEDKDIKFYLL